MPNAREIAGENLGVFQRYAPNDFKKLEKKCIAADGNDKTTRKNMIDFMIEHGFAKEAAPGHGSGKPGDKMQPATEKWIKAVQKQI